MSSGKWRPSCLGLNVLTNNHFSLAGETNSSSPEREAEGPEDQRLVSLKKQLDIELKVSPIILPRIWL